MFGALNFKIYIIIGAVVLTMAGGFAVYFKWSQAQMQAMAANNAKLETAVQIQEETIKQQQEAKTEEQKTKNEKRKKYLTFITDDIDAPVIFNVVSAF